MRLLAAAFVALLMSTLSGAALAHSQTVLDGDDVSGPLDTVATRAKHFSVAQTHPEKEWTELEFRVVTYETWSNDRLGGIDNHITIEFKLDSDDDVDRCFEIRQGPDGDLEGQMFSVGCEFVVGAPVGRPQAVRRPDQHSLQVAFRKRLLGKGVRVFKWRTVTSFDDDGDPDCPRPDPLPPERRYATCTDFTKWKSHRVQE